MQPSEFFKTLGAFGKIHKGVYTKETEVLDVAIKTLRGKQSLHLQCMVFYNNYM